MKNRFFTISDGQKFIQLYSVDGSVNFIFFAMKLLNVGSGFSIVCVDSNAPNWQNKNLFSAKIEICVENQTVEPNPINNQ